jgi:hypothetical protein
MTEADWLTGTDFTAHVRFISNRLSPRRQRLLAVGFCRAVAHLFDHPELTEALVGIDHYADDMASTGAVERVRQRCRELASAFYEEYVTAVDTGRGDGLRSFVRSEIAWATAYAATVRSRSIKWAHARQTPRFRRTPVRYCSSRSRRPTSRPRPANRPS